MTIDLFTAQSSNHMKTKLLLWCAAGLLVALTRTSAATLYVDAGSTNAVPPFTNWANAAAVIQDAVDAAVAGDLILVTNGVYQSGATAVYGMNNRVAVTKPVTVRSVNGPGVTSIVGSGPLGPEAVRCVYLANGAVLAGFTLTNGATQTYGYAYESGGGVSCAGPGAVVSNCVFTGNAAYFYGGGAYQGTLNNCTFTGNSAGYGGGASSGTLNNCTLTANTAVFGGGACWSTLNNCTLTGNSADNGGGASGSALNNCIVYDNTASSSGANYAGGTLNYSCTTPDPGSGVGNITNEPAFVGLAGGNLRLQSNSACINAGNNDYVSGRATTDLDGNFRIAGGTVDMGAYEYWSGPLGALSVVVVAAYTNVAVGFAVDLQALIGGQVSALRWDFGDGVVVSNGPWASHAWPAPGDYVVELRAYNESEPAGVAASVTVHVFQKELYVALNNGNPVPPYSSWATAATNIQDALDATVPGALVWVSNGVYQTGARAVDGMSNRVVVSKLVTVRSVNGPAVTQIVGNRVPGTTNGPAAVRCVYLANGAVLTGFTLTNGATQGSGVFWNPSQSGGGVWCEGLGAVVSNCVFTGNSAASDGGGVFSGTLNNCAFTSNSAGWYGGGAREATLNNCTFTGNSAGWQGGATRDGTLNNCTLTGNSAYAGGGAAGGTLNNCTLTSNSVTRYGGGATVCLLNNCMIIGNSAAVPFGYGGGVDNSLLNNCTVVGNSADDVGGSWNSTLNNCIVYYNTANTSVPNYDDYERTLNYCSTTPAPQNGVGNITNAPLFVDTNGWSNLRLQSNSPCINAGHNASVATNTDLDGRPRIVGGVVDLGAYEYQGSGMGEFIGWLQQSGLPPDGSADDVDTDHDGHNNWQEWLAGTNPTNARSVLWLAAPVITPTNVTLTWTSVSNRTYTLEQASNLGGAPAFSVLRSNLVGLPGTTSWTDTNAPVSSPRFYQLRVSP